MRERDRDLLWVAAGHAVGEDPDVVVGIEEVEGGLQNTDVRLTGEAWSVGRLSWPRSGLPGSLTSMPNKTMDLMWGWSVRNVRTSEVIMENSVFGIVATWSDPSDWRSISGAVWPSPVVHRDQAWTGDGDVCEELTFGILLGGQDGYFEDLQRWTSEEDVCGRVHTFANLRILLMVRTSSP